MEPEKITVTWALDAEAVRRIRAVASLEGKGVQDKVSECLHSCADASRLLANPSPTPRPAG